MGVLAALEIAVTAVLFQLITRGNPGEAAGISSEMYAFATVGFACLIGDMRKEKGFRKKPSSYYFALIGLGMLTNIAPMGSMVSLVLHGSGIVLGLVFVLLNRKADSAESRMTK